MNITGLLLLPRSPNQIPSQSNHTLQMEIHPALPGGCSKLCSPCWVVWYLQLNCCRAQDRWQQYYWGRQQINLCGCLHCKGTVEMGHAFSSVGILEALVLPGLGNGLLVLKVAAGASLCFAFVSSYCSTVLGAHSTGTFLCPLPSWRNKKIFSCFAHLFLFHCGYLGQILEWGKLFSSM